MERTAPPNPRFLSLRWKALTALSLVLVLVNASLAYLAYRQAVRQFDLQQAEVRERQSRQLREMVEGHALEMSRFAALVPLMGPNPPLESLQAQLEDALRTNGAMLDVEWDIRSVHWLAPGLDDVMTWPDQAERLPPELRDRIAAAPEAQIELLHCRFECGQYLAAPILWNGRFAGTLVLVRSLADSLLSFNELTGAEVAIVPRETPAREGPGASASGQLESGSKAGGFPAITHRERSEPILARVDGGRSAGLRGGVPVLVSRGGAWYEVFRIPALAEGIDAYVINDVTAQQEAISQAIRFSIAIGIMGLIISEGLLLFMLRQPLSRLRRIASALPLLAENRYRDLRERLPPISPAQLVSDEMDLMVGTVGSLTDRMESLQRDREQAEARLVWLADHDPLTQLYNRRRFHADFERVLDQAVRFGHQGAVLFFDLDQFKDVNDISGHQVGDALLQRVAEQLQTLTRPCDILARLGGDEFAWLLPEATAEQAIEVAERAQRIIRSIVMHARSRRHQVSASIGIVLFPEQGKETHQLMANADLAMYQAKEKGRGRWHIFSLADQSRERADARVLWGQHIAEALTQDRFELRFQPIVAVTTGEIVHYEALLRMRDPQGDMVYPDRFVPVAEKTGQIQAIDHWVLSHALGIMNARPELHLSVNLSANAMDDPLLLPDVEQLLKRFGVEPMRLTFEITETAAINSILRATRLMRGIQRLGCRFALDDFGSGYASYAYLRQLPVDDVKVDGAFIRNLSRSREDRIFVKAITDIAHGMGKRVIAEFVEDGDILRVLVELGVDFAQGYHFGRPVPLSECPGLAATRVGRSVG
jgi:diguanylate cyclase (GGDEF)-like protein